MSALSFVCLYSSLPGFPLPQIEVAVKTLRVDAMGHGEQEFMREARIMITLNHPCIVRLIGVTRGKPMMLVS